VTLPDLAFEISGTAAEAIVLLLLLWRRVFRTLPVFFAYIVWSLLSDLGQSATANFYPHSSFRIYLISLAIDSLFQFGVLIELSRSVLSPMAKLLPRWTPFAVGVVILIVCGAIWPFAKAPGFSQYTLESQLLVHLQQSFSILRILFFLVLAGCSQLLSIGWRDRELQIATGLGVYSMVSLTVSVLHTRQALGASYHLLDQIMVASYVCSLLYWAYCFAQQEAARREFTPQMQNFLLAVAGTARSSRVSLSRSRVDNDRDDR